MGEAIAWAATLGHILGLVVILFCMQALIGHDFDAMVALAIAIGVGALQRTYRKRPAA